MAAVPTEENSAKPKFHIFLSYIKTIENSIESNLFRNLYFQIGDRVIDVLDDGDLSCATYVTSVLYLFDLIKERHTTVVATVRDLLESGWFKIETPRKGAVIIWDYKKKDDGTQGKHRHIGFFINNETAISNDSSKRTVARHHPTFGNFSNGEARRDIIAYYWNDKLNA